MNPARAQVVSLNAAVERTLDWRGGAVRTGIFKEPVQGPRMARADGLEGDCVVDRRYHGAEYQALYAYPGEHYASWREAFPEVAWGWGAFGENLTLAGWDEETAHIGDRFRIGGAEVEVTQPRWPCFKLSRKLGAPRVAKHLLETGRTGFYLRVLTPGPVAAGDPVERILADPAGMTVAELLRLTLDGDAAPAALERAMAVPALPAPWREGLRQRLR